MTVNITSITAKNGGAELCVRVRISNGENSETRELFLLARQYAELRPREGEISEEYFEELSSASQVCCAVKRGMYILGYGACSGKNMILKLRAKGFDRESAAQAAEHLCELGYINENEDAAREAERALKKGWGRRRIASMLCEKGYSNEAVENAIDTLRDYDFSSACAAIVRKKYGSVPEDSEQRKKLFAALLRYGYSSSEIKNAFLSLEK